MTNILTVLPDFDCTNFTHVLPSLEKALITTADLLTLEPIDIAKRAQLPANEVRKLADALLDGLRKGHDDGKHVLAEDNDQCGQTANAPFTSGDRLSAPQAISTLDDVLDERLNGGIHSGYLTEITGESAAGKTQFLLTLLLSAQLKAQDGRSKTALYLSTEAQLQTTRLSQILENHSKLVDLNADDKPTLARVQSTHIYDLEAQEHILRYQVPVVIERFNVGLVVVDSIAANYRAEFDKSKANKGAQSLAQRSTQVAQLGAVLRNMARMHNIAVVVANQVADRFEPQAQLVPLSQSTQRSRPGSPPNVSASLPRPPMSSAVPHEGPRHAPLLSTDDPLALDHQQRFFTGWGDDSTVVNMKTPSLGLTWTNQLATRIALLREPVYEDRAYRPGEDRVVARWDRRMKVVFSAWCVAGETPYEIWQGGVRSVTRNDAKDE